MFCQKDFCQLEKTQLLPLPFMGSAPQKTTSVAPDSCQAVGQRCTDSALSPTQPNPTSKAPEDAMQGRVSSLWWNTQA